jgi:hypothetical protein
VPLMPPRKVWAGELVAQRLSNKKKTQREVQMYLPGVRIELPPSKILFG